MAPAGRYVARVVEIKQSRGRRFAILDGGMHHFFAATGAFGQVIKRNHRVSAFEAPTDRPIVPHDLVGPLCTPLDTLGRQVQLPTLATGDLVVFEQAGAYGYSASPSAFLGHPPPVELLVQQGSVFNVSAAALPS
ncbi:MAG: hypothetical protein JRH20_12135 [Deltaproteobacteria bacterium]|nr:hypothetical protein [Deltaproteobacteria bacterium]